MNLDCQSTITDYANDLALKTVPQPSGAISSLDVAHLSLEVFSLFFLSLSLINFLAMGKALLCVPTKNQGPQEEGSAHSPLLIV